MNIDKALEHLKTEEYWSQTQGFVTYEALRNILNALKEESTEGKQ